MWIGVGILVALVVVVGLGQWWVTRPTTRRPIDTSRARADIDAQHGTINDIFGGQGLP